MFGRDHFLYFEIVDHEWFTCPATDDLHLAVNRSLDLRDVNSLFPKRSLVGRNLRPELRVERQQHGLLPVAGDQPQGEQRDDDRPRSRYANAASKGTEPQRLACNADGYAERNDQIEFGVAENLVAEPLHEARD